MSIEELVSTILQIITEELPEAVLEELLGDSSKMKAIKAKLVPLKHQLKARAAELTPLQKLRLSAFAEIAAGTMQEIYRS